MHTFFINTSNNVNVSRHEQLFDNLVSRNNIRVFKYDLDELNACAEKISETITRDNTMAEIYNIIVYVEISERNEHALAAEKVASLQIEETLFSRLYDLGRKPNQALILFGENFTRDAEYGLGNEYRKNVRNALWEMFPLPKLDKAKKILKNIKKDYPTITKDNLNEYKVAVWTSLTQDCLENSLLHSENDFVVATLYELAESIRDENADEVDLLDELYNALTNEKEHVQLQVTAEKVLYAHVRLADSDFNAKNRTEYRILLYVYYCAVTGSIKLCKADPEVGEGVDAGTTLGIDTIPDINWDAFSTSIKEKKSIFEHELEQIELSDEEFPMFNDALLNEKSIVALSSDTPKLITEVKAHRGLTVSQLQEAVNGTLNEIEEKNDENAKTISNFITKVTDSFSAVKDAKMKNVKYKKDEDFIENVQLTRDFIRDAIDSADSRIASHKRLSMAATHVDELVKETRIRTDYYFDCMKKGSLLYVIAVIFTLLFAIPYALIQRDVFNVFHGWIFYVSTIAAVISAFSVGYFIFKQIYKSRILKELGYLCDRFAVTQKEKQDCLEKYATLIQNDIPLSFCLTLYDNEFKEYVARKESIPEFITYHTKLLRNYIQYINNISNELDIAHIGTEPEPIGEYTSIIAIERDKYQNNTVYALVDDRTIEEYYSFETEGGNR